MPAPTANEAPEAIKARGAFYTPPAIAQFLARWAVRSADDRVLEPSCGDGAFVAAAGARLKELGRRGIDGHLIGIELYPSEAEKARLACPDADIRIGSFFGYTVANLGPADAVVGNPPYIRYHRWTGDSRSDGKARAAELGVDIGSLSSSWAPFAIHSTAFLRQGGRLGLVLPAELLHADYAAPVRNYLLSRFRSVLVIAFDRLVFADAQVDAVLLLASDDGDPGLRVIRARDERALAGLTLTRSAERVEGIGHARSQRWSAAVDEDAAAVYASVVQSGRFQRLGEIASVDIGFVSGANSYFVLDPETAARFGLPARVLQPTVERPSQMRGLRVLDSETRLLFRPDDESLSDPAVQAYVEAGASSGISARYKPRNRRPWFRVPLPRQSADLFLTYMSHHTPLLVVNSGARSTNLVHGVTLRDASQTDVCALAAASLSDVWALSAEVEGRAYGGGVLKLETKEAERVLVPLLTDGISKQLARLFPRLDALVRAGRRPDATAAVDAVLGTGSPDIARAAAVFRERRQGRGARRKSLSA